MHDLEATRLLVETGELERIDCLRYRHELRWRFCLGLPYMPLAGNYFCQQESFPFDVNEFLTSSLLDTPPVSLGSFLTLLYDYGRIALTTFTCQGEALLLGILSTHISETF